MVYFCRVNNEKMKYTAIHHHHHIPDEKLGGRR